MSENDYKEIKEQLDRVEKAVLAHKTVLTLDEACAYTNIRKSQMYKYTMNQSIPHYKPNGKQIYFKREELDEWLLKNKVSTKKDIDNKATTYVTINK